MDRYICMSLLRNPGFRPILKIHRPIPIDIRSTKCTGWTSTRRNDIKRLSICLQVWIYLMISLGSIAFFPIQRKNRSNRGRCEEGWNDESRSSIPLAPKFDHKLDHRPDQLGSRFHSATAGRIYRIRSVAQRILSALVFQRLLELDGRLSADKQYSLSWTIFAD